MFSISNKTENGFEKVILKDETSGSYAAVIPGCSAMLQEFVVQQDGEKVNVIDGFQSLDEFKERLAEKGFASCKLSPFACRLYLAKYTFGGTEYTVQKSLRPTHAIHGLLYDKAFTIISSTADEEQASVVMKYEYRAEDPGYPFNYDCIVTWQLEAENKLTVTTQCVNQDEGLIPMQDGWHPYFTLGDAVDDLHLEFQAKNMVEFSSDLVPTKKLLPYTRFSSIEKIGDTQLDNSFLLDLQECQPLCVLRNPARKIEIQFFPDESYPYLQIYIPPHRKSIAIENLSAPPDTFNNGMELITLESGQSASFKTSYKIKLLNTPS